MKDLDGVEADGELAGEGHEDEEHVEEQEGPPVLPHHHLQGEMKIFYIIIRFKWIFNEFYRHLRLISDKS